MLDNNRTKTLSNPTLLWRDIVPPNRRARVAILGGAAFVLLIGIAVPSLLPRDKVHPVQAAVPPPGFQVTDSQWATLTFGTVAAQTFQTERDTDGKIAIDDDTATPVFSPYSGRVAKIFVKAGEQVKKGDPLLAVEASEFVQGQNDLVTAVANLASAQAQLNLSETAEKRQHDLFEAKGGALKDWQQAQVDLANARAGFRTAEITLAAVKNRLRILGKSDAEIAAIAAAPDGARMAAEAVVQAPIAGTVIQRQVGPGEYINSAASGGSQVFTVGDLSTVWLVANLREADAALVHPGNTVEVRVPAYPGRLFTGKVTYVAPAIDPATRRLTVRAELDNSDNALKPEMFGSFRVIAGGEASSPAVPDSAVIYEGDAARVWVADPGVKSIALRPIRAGRSHDGMLEVVDGLKVGETVVVRGALFIDRAAKGD